MPVYRAAITSPSALDHYILTIIETIAPEGRDGAARIELPDRASPLIDVHVGETVVRIAAAPFDSDALWECSTDGELAFAVKEVGRLTLAGSFGAETLETPIGSKRGDGFIVVEVAR